jgi:hypothetical protein
MEVCEGRRDGSSTSESILHEEPPGYVVALLNAMAVKLLAVYRGLAEISDVYGIEQYGKISLNSSASKHFGEIDCLLLSCARLYKHQVGRGSAKSLTADASDSSGQARHVQSYSYRVSARSPAGGGTNREPLKGGEMKIDRQQRNYIYFRDPAVEFGKDSALDLEWNYILLGV